MNESGGLKNKQPEGWDFGLLLGLSLQELCWYVCCALLPCRRGDLFLGVSPGILGFFPRLVLKPTCRIPSAIPVPRSLLDHRSNDLCNKCLFLARTTKLAEESLAF
jgi:hypothetical protein